MIVPTRLSVRQTMSKMAHMMHAWSLHIQKGAYFLCMSVKHGEIPTMDEKHSHL